MLKIPGNLKKKQRLLLEFLSLWTSLSQDMSLEMFRIHSRPVSEHGGKQLHPSKSRRDQASDRDKEKEDRNIY